MAILDQLILSFVARNEGFLRRVRDSRRSVQRFGAAAARAQALASSLFGVALPGLGVAGLTAFISRSVRAGDELAKFADRIGVSSEALAGLRFAGELTGVATNQLQLGLQRMTRRVAEAAVGTGEAKNALLELNIEAEQLNRLSPDQQFLAISEAFEKIKTSGDRVRLAMRLFDTEGVALVNTLALGRRELAEIFAEAEKRGLAVSRQDLRRLESANDALTRLRANARGFGRQMAIALSPDLENISASIDSWFDSMGGVRAAARATAAAYREIKDLLGPIIDLLARMREGALSALDAAGAAAVERAGRLGHTFARTPLSLLAESAGLPREIAQNLPSARGFAMTALEGLLGARRSLVGMRNVGAQGLARSGVVPPMVEAIPPRVRQRMQVQDPEQHRILMQIQEELRRLREEGGLP